MPSAVDVMLNLSNAWAFRQDKKIGHYNKVTARQGSTVFLCAHEFIETGVRDTISVFAVNFVFAFECVFVDNERAINFFTKIMK